MIMEWTLIDPWRCVRCNCLRPSLLICPWNNEAHRYRTAVPLLMRIGPSACHVWPAMWAALVTRTW